MLNLFRAFDGTGQPIPGEEGVRLWYTESGFQTSVDAGKTGYSGAENGVTVVDHAGGEPESPPPAETSDAPDQSTQVLDAIRLAACQPYVTAYFNFLLADEPVLSGWQSGALWADRTRKDSWPAFRQAIAAATTGAVDCGALKGGRPSVDYQPRGFRPASAPTERRTPSGRPLLERRRRRRERASRTASSGTAPTSAPPLRRRGRTRRSRRRRPTPTPCGRSTRPATSVTLRPPSP